jgi:TRAP-type C4-dicarboxylate transport system permease small subunit
VKKTYHWLEACINTIDDIAVIIACMLLMALMLVVVADVGMRYLFNAPLAWSYEIIEYFLMPGLFFLAVSHTLRANAHVSVDIIHNYLSTPKRYVLEALSHALSTPVFAMATWFSALQTIAQFNSGTHLANGLELTSWTTSFLLPLGFGFLTLRALLKTIGYVASIGASEPLTALPAISGSAEVPQ